MGTTAFAFYTNAVGSFTSLTTTNATTSSGSTFIVSVGRGVTNLFSTSPTDSKGNTYYPLGLYKNYGALWPSSGTGIYYATNCTGGSGHNWSVQTAAGDEVTVAVVEIKDAYHIGAWAQNYPAANPQTSSSVTVTNHAVLVAAWAGDSTLPTGLSVSSPFSIETGKYAPPPDSNFVQCGLATREADAGSYTVTWTATPDSGALLWLIVVDGATGPNTVASGKLSATGAVRFN